MSRKRFHVEHSVFSPTVFRAIAELARGEVPPLLVSIAALLCTVALLLPPLAESQEQQQCAPPNVPMCLCACVSPATRPCETLPGLGPAGETIRRHLVAYLVREAPEQARPFVAAATGWNDADLAGGFAIAWAAARCFSGGAAGPPNPAAIPAAEVKVWVLAVLDSAPAPQRALRPLVAALPDEIVRRAYLHAVELKRGVPYGTFTDLLTDPRRP